MKDEVNPVKDEVNPVKDEVNPVKDEVNQHGSIVGLVPAEPVLRTSAEDLVANTSDIHGVDDVSAEAALMTLEPLHAEAPSISDDKVYRAYNMANVSTYVHDNQVTSTHFAIAPVVLFSADPLLYHFLTDSCVSYMPY